MFVIVKFGKNEAKLFNPDCSVDNLLHCIKEECNIDPEGFQLIFSLLKCYFAIPTATHAQFNHVLNYKFRGREISSS